jgi:hypothetical protein
MDNPYTDDMYSYTVFCRNVHTGEEFDFTMEAYSKAEVLAVCKDDFGNNVIVDYIMGN